VQAHILGAGCAGLLFVLTTGCAVRTGRLSVPRSNDLYIVIVDGDHVATGEANLLELLRRKATSLRLGEYPFPREYEPLVVVDGIPLDGLYRLEDIPAFHADTVRILRAAEALVGYGSRARNGAIVVTTKRGA
jgi:hypothetical protein